jgi:hypothetical protein
MNNVTDLAISGAEVARVVVSALRLRLQPKQVALGGGGELQSEDAAVCLGGRLGARLVFVGDKAAIGRDHDQVQDGVVQRVASLAPAEVHQVYSSVSITGIGEFALELTIFGVKVDVTWLSLGLHLIWRGGGLVA